MNYSNKEIFSMAHGASERVANHIKQFNAIFTTDSNNLMFNDFADFLNSMDSNEIIKTLNLIDFYSVKNNIDPVFQGETAVSYARLNHFNTVNAQKVVSIKMVEDYFKLEFVYLCFAKVAYINRFFNTVSHLKHLFVNEDVAKSINVAMTLTLYKSIKKGKEQKAKINDLREKYTKEDLLKLEKELNVEPVSAFEIIKFYGSNGDYEDKLSELTCNTYVKTVSKGQESFELKENTAKTKISFKEIFNTYSNLKTLLEKSEILLFNLEKQKEENRKILNANDKIQNIYRSMKSNKLSIVEKQCTDLFLNYLVLCNREKELSTKRENYKEYMATLERYFEPLTQILVENESYRLEKIQQKYEELNQQISKWDAIDNLDEVSKKRMIRETFLEDFDNFYSGFSNNVYTLNEVIKKSIFITKTDIDLGNKKIIKFNDLISNVFEDNDNCDLVNAVINSFNNILNEKFDLFKSISDSFLGMNKEDNRLKFISHFIDVVEQVKKDTTNTELREKYEILFYEVFTKNMDHLLNKQNKTNKIKRA